MGQWEIITYYILCCYEVICLLFLNRRVAKVEWGTFFLCRSRCQWIGQDLQFDCCIGIFHDATIHCLLVSMATEDVFACIFLLQYKMLVGSTNSLKRMKFPIFWYDYHNFVWYASRGRWVLKMHFFPLITLENKKDHLV
jgi:hypothetical protein